LPRIVVGPLAGASLEGTPFPPRSTAKKDGPEITLQPPSQAGLLACAGLIPPPTSLPTASKPPPAVESVISMLLLLGAAVLPFGATPK